MSLHFTKLFSSITESTVWSEPLATRVVWVTLLAKCDADGHWFGSLHGLARQANVSLDEAAEAVQRFLQPDPHSTSPEHGGRRIVAFYGGWQLLNYGKYRGMRDQESTLERKREWDRKHRPSGAARVNAATQQSPTRSDESPSRPTHADAEADVEASKEKDLARATRLPKDWTPPSAWISDAIKIVGARKVSVDIGMETDKFKDHWISQGGARGRKADWHATWRNWFRNARPTGAPNGNQSHRRTSLAEDTEQRLQRLADSERR